MKGLSKNKFVAVLFIICIFSISLISDMKVMNYYVNDEIDYNEWNSSTDSKFETDYISNFWLKYQYVNLNGAIKRLIGQQQMNGVVKLNNGYLHQPISYIEDDVIISNAENSRRFQEVLAERGIDYVWFTMPYVVDKYHPELPIGYQDDYGNDNLDRLTKALIDNSVEVVDLRDKLNSQGLETYDIFYRTDHHWTTEGGFWAYNQIIDFFEEKYGVEASEEVRDISNYDITKYKEWHLGSGGQRTGKYFAGIDDFDLITPKFETYLQVYNTDFGGEMSYMMINMEPLQEVNYISRYTYDNVLKGSRAYWHNPSASIDMKVMLIGDSMSKAVMPYLALTFRDVAYGASCTDANMVDSQLIDSFQPDVIISMNFVANITEKSFDWKIINE